MGDTTSGARVLVVDDEPVVLRVVQRILEPEGYELKAVATAAEAIAILTSETADPPDVVLTDLHLKDGTGFEVMLATKTHRPEAVTVVMSGRATLSSAVEAMRGGAYDYLAKPFDDPQILSSAVARSLGHKRLIERNRYLEQRLDMSERYEGLIGFSREMRQVVSLVDTVANTDASVLVQGESGTGKELVVRAIHARSKRRERSFVAINCGALTESLLESELFGHERGAFTGAATAHKGVFEQASGGTIFLDEVGDLPLSTQVRLLRVLQEREVRPVGSNSPRTVDVRVVAATHRDLAADVAAGKFRQDLYYRLNVVVITVPPLRDRREDIPLLATHFVRKHATRHGRKVHGLTTDALTLLAASDWTGNVRELENIVERAVVLSQSNALTEADFAHLPKADTKRNTSSSVPFQNVPFARAKHDFEKEYLERLLVHARGNLADAARIAGLDRSNMRRLLRRFEIQYSEPKKLDNGAE